MSVNKAQIQWLKSYRYIISHFIYKTSLKEEWKKWMNIYLNVTKISVYFKLLPKTKLYKNLFISFLSLIFGLISNWAITCSDKISQPLDLVFTIHYELKGQICFYPHRIQHLVNSCNYYLNWPETVSQELYMLHSRWKENKIQPTLEDPKKKKFIMANVTLLHG